MNPSPGPTPIPSPLWVYTFPSYRRHADVLSSSYLPRETPHSEKSPSVVGRLLPPKANPSLKTRDFFTRRTPKVHRRAPHRPPPAPRTSGVNLGIVDVRRQAWDRGRQASSSGWWTSGVNLGIVDVSLTSSGVKLGIGGRQALSLGSWTSGVKLGMVDVRR